MPARTISHLAALVTIIIWGSTFVVTKELLSDFSPTEILVFRFLLAGALLLPFTRGFFRPWGRTTEIRLALAGLSGVTAYYLCENAALQAADATDVGLIVTIIPLLTAGLAWLTRGREGLDRRFAAGAGLALAGVLLVIGNGQVLHLGVSGGLLACGAALAFAGYTLLVRHLPPGIPPLVAVARSFWWGLAAALPFLAGDHREAGAERFLEPANLAGFLFLAALASGLCYALWNKAIGELGALRTNLYVYTVPLVNTALSALCLGERPGILALSGGALVIAGLLLSGISRPAPRTRPAGRRWLRCWRKGTSIAT